MTNGLKIIYIEDPRDVTYPLECETYDNPLVVYHGTSNVFTERIENKGWLINDQPYNIDDIEFVCKAYEDLHYTESESYSVIRTYTLGFENLHVGKKSASFSQNYWTARNYAIKPGGETIKNLILAIDDFLNLHKNLKISKELCNIREKYIKDTKNHYPVVYCVKVEPEWFEKWETPDLDICFKSVNLFANESILPSAIVARIDFPKGAIRFFPALNQPHPLSWELEKFKEWLSEHPQDYESKDIRDKYLGK